MTNVNFRTDSDVKAQTQAVLERLGLDMSTAFNMYMRQIIARQAIPFDVALPETDAIQRAIANRKAGVGFVSADEFLANMERAG